MFTVQDIQIMHEAGVRVQLPGERTAQVLPADTPLRNLLQVEMLDFSNSSLYKIPRWLKRFTNLRSLDLSKNHLDADSDLLESLQAMPRLDVLNLSDNPLFTETP
ncbi:MAG: leucine-rich repeat domain-containing protein, partial [Candidatus Electrothrix sp. AR3]|nr:leucine-rich repeat domain-containing protein [Candidatus Electrothrix sp. AR3]